MDYFTDKCNPDNVCQPHFPENCEPCDPGFFPVPPPIPPIMGQPHIPGFNPSQQMAYVVSKVNECINRWNYIQNNCYDALNRVVGCAVANDVYYGCEEVKFEHGYSSDDSCPYGYITIKKFDKRGMPISVQLGLAFDNTSNSNIKQSIEEFSFVKSANAIITAANPASENGWNGPAMYRCSPINGNVSPDTYIAGFNKCGTLKVFKGDVDSTVLCQNEMVDCIGAAIPIIIDGEVTEQAKGLTQKMAICAIGYKSSCGDRVMFYCGDQTETGMQGITVANLLKTMGCTTAVITAMQDVTEKGVESIGMEYLGKATATPNRFETPKNTAFWYVTKRPFCGYKNEFEAEIADLVQTTGMNANGISELEHNVNIAIDKSEQALELAQSHEDRIVVLENEVQELDGRLDTAEKNITDLQKGLEAANQRITQEISDREVADTLLRQEIEEEEANRTAADAVLQGNINKEAIDRANADLKIEQNLAKEVANRTEADQLLQNQINGLVGGSTSLPYVKRAGDTMTGDLTFEADKTVKVGRGPTNPLDVATKQYVDDQISGGTTPGGDVSKEYVDQQIANVQGQMNAKVNKSGDTMTGPLVLSGEPTANEQASNKAYVDKQVKAVDDKISGITGGGTDLPYVKKSGDTMTGQLIVPGPTGEGSAANKGYVDGEIAKVTGGQVPMPFVKKAGDTMTGPLVLSGNPAASNQAANKQYVDQTVAGYMPRTGGQFTGPVSLPGDPTSGLQAATKDYVDKHSGISSIVGTFKRIFADTITANPPGKNFKAVSFKIPAFASLAIIKCKVNTANARDFSFGFSPTNKSNGTVYPLYSMIAKSYDSPASTGEYEFSIIGTLTEASTSDIGVSVPRGNGNTHTFIISGDSVRNGANYDITGFIYSESSENRDTVNIEIWVM